MKNFIFKSTNADLQKMFQSIETIQKNVLYVTYRIDMLIKRLDKVQLDRNLQKQVDEYFDEDNQTNIPEESKDLDWNGLRNRCPHSWASTTTRSQICLQRITRSR